EAREKELQSAQANIEQQVQQLANALNEESKRREGAEQRAGEIGQQRGALELELGQLRRDLEKTQKDLLAQEERSHAEHAKLEARTQELRTAHAKAGQQVQRLTNALNEEAKRREGAEKEAGNIGQKRNELETAMWRLQKDLQVSQERLEAQEQ